MELITENIQDEFNKCFDDADKKLEKYLTSLSEENLKLNPTHTELVDNFFNSETVQKNINDLNKKNNVLESLKNGIELKIILDELKILYPYKIISYYQIIDILNKYGLYLGMSNYYDGDIPLHNCDEITSYKERLLVQGSRISALLKFDKPVGLQRFNERTRSIHVCSFYICSTSSSFVRESVATIGREFIYCEGYNLGKYNLGSIFKKKNNIKPIVFNPLLIENPLAKELRLFHIVTKWV